MGRKLMITIILSLVTAMLIACGDSEESAQANVSYMNVNANGYETIRIADLERNPDKYIGEKVAIKCEAYCTNVYGNDYVSEFYNGNIYTMSITRDYVAYDRDGNGIGYLITGDVCIVYGIVGKDTYGNLFIDTEKVIIY